MPKEIIKNRYENSSEFVVEVRWGRGSEYLQLATVVRDPVTGELAAERSVYADLDRQGANDLIRVVRRARDQAYGKDE